MSPTIDLTLEELECVIYLCVYAEKKGQLLVGKESGKLLPKEVERKARALLPKKTALDWLGGKQH